MTEPGPRFGVEAVQRRLPDGRQEIHYWRVLDAETGLRANGSAKFETRAQAQRWCDAFNR